jgi:dephospho-CoA kinase
MDAPAAALLLGRQMRDAEKRARATWVIPSETLEEAHAAVRQILREIRAVAASRQE